MRPLLAALVLAGCASRAPVMLVSNVTVDGYDLVIERCPVTSGNTSRSWDAFRSCETERHRIPHVGLRRRDTSPAMTPDREANYRRIGSARVALTACVEQQSMHGLVAIELVLESRGQIAGVEPALLADCVRAALGEQPFGVSRLVTRIAFSIVAPEVVP